MRVEVISLHRFVSWKRWIPIWRAGNSPLEELNWLCPWRGCDTSAGWKHHLPQPCSCLHYKSKTANLFQSFCAILHVAVSFCWVMAVWMSKMSILQLCHKLVWIFLNIKQADNNRLYCSWWNFLSKCLNVPCALSQPGLAHCNHKRKLNQLRLEPQVVSEPSCCGKDISPSSQAFSWSSVQGMAVGAGFHCQDTCLMLCLFHDFITCSIIKWKSNVAVIPWGGHEHSPGRQDSTSGFKNHLEKLQRIIKYHLCGKKSHYQNEKSAKTLNTDFHLVYMLERGSIFPFCVSKVWGMVFNGMGQTGSSQDMDLIPYIYKQNHISCWTLLNEREEVGMGISASQSLQRKKEGKCWQRWCCCLQALLPLPGHCKWWVLALLHLVWSITEGIFRVGRAACGSGRGDRDRALLWLPQPWQCPGPAWTGFGAAWDNGSVPAHGMI